MSPHRLVSIAPRLAVLSALAIGAAFVPPAAAGVQCTARSGAGTVALVELYTSEGCSSCPPADRWLSETFRGASDDRRAVALAFHVDYWDRLGWKDRFAASAYTDRQYAAMRANGASFVYTPQVLVQGRDQQTWRGAGTEAITAINARPARASIDLGVTPGAEGIAVEAAVQIPATADRRGAVTYVALVEGGFATDVKAGENSGVRLTHDHVVRDFRVGTKVDERGGARTAVTLPWPSERGRDASVVVFVQNPRTGDVLQTLAVPLAADACPARR